MTLTARVAHKTKLKVKKMVYVRSTGEVDSGGLPALQAFYCTRV
ncbi:MAG: hypothetical protein QXV23_02500 [Candidatus Bathyarchaeia archaeon]